MFDLNPKSAHALSCSDALELVQILLKQAQECQKPSIKLALCDKVDAQLKQMKQFVKRPSLFATNSSNSTIGLSNKSNTGVDDQAPLREAIARAYLTHAQLMVDLRCPDQAQLSRSRADKWGGPGTSKSTAIPISTRKTRTEIAIVSDTIFPRDIPSLTSDWYFPELDGRVANTPQLVSCLALLKEEPNAIPDSALEPVPRAWRKKISQNPSERERLEVLATDLIRAFTQDEFKDRKVIAEVICLVPVLEVDDSRFLLGQFLDNIKNSSILSIGALRGLAHVLRAVAPDHLFSQDLIEVLGPMSTKLQNAHSESPEYIFELTVAVSSVLDAMTDAKVTGIKRVEMHEPLLVFLASLRNSDDPHLKFHASYAFQALLCVPNDESPWEATVRRTTKVVKGISGLVSAVKGLDLNAFMTGLQNVQEGFDGIQQLFELGKTAYEGVSAVYESEQDFVAGLKEGLTFNRTRAWYRALRGADTLLEGGELTKFKDLVCGAVCRCEVEFQWGVCQRLGRVAANSRWGIETRQGAVRFLEEIYRKDAVWGYLPPIKSYIIELLKQLSVTVNDLPEVSLLIKDLAHDGDAVKREVYRSILEKEAGPGSRLAVSGLPEPVHSPLLDRVQGKTDVKIDLRRLARQRIDERGGAVYVPPMAKRYSKVADSDDKPFPLEPMVDDFLKNNQKVLLLRGVSGAGKTTFNRQLDLRLWEAYLDNPETSRIPLLINLPAINRPEHDLIAKHLRICEFSESQIHELKSHEIVVICDGYDEVRQSQNLYDMNEFNKLGGWRAQMIVGCRSEHLGQDYLHLFQPDRTNHADPESFQQAVLVPFSMDQVNEYIEGYVKIKQPVWGLSDYKGVLEQIPSLQDLVTNPFLLSLSLEVLPRITEPNQRLAANKITRVLLYDEFVTQWLERNKKRVATLSLTDQERKAFESLSDDGFTQHGLDYLKNLSAAIYDEQDGNPIVEYSKARDASTWKEQFFGRRTEETHLLRMSIPMTRSGGRFGFVHRSILEYGVCRAICEPQKQTGIRLDAATEIVEQPGRRMSVGSIYSFDMEPRQPVAAVESVVMSPEPDSPLVRRSFVKDASVIHFLVERVQSEPTFRDQLQCYIEASKLDKKWRTAAANAISILVRAGVSFSHQNLRGIKIPGADVSQGVFDSAELQDADLRRANFLGVRLRQADLSRALLSGSLFGELPLLSDAKMSNASACTPDGTRFVTGTRDGRILVYNTLTWTLDTTLSGADGVVTELAVSRDSSLVASSSDSTEGKPVVMVWQLETGVISHTFENHGARYQGLVFLPTGHYLAMVSNQAICLFDLRTGAMNKSLPQTAAIDSAAISCTPDGRWLAVSFKDGSVRLLDSDSLECHYTLYGLQNLMSSMTFSSDGKYLAVVSNWFMKNTLQMYDVSDGSRAWTLNKSVPLNFGSIVFSHDSRLAACGTKKNTIQLFDPATGETGHTLRGHSGEITSIAFSPDGLQICTGSQDRTVRLWNSRTGNLVGIFEGHSSDILSAVFSADAKLIISFGSDGTVQLWLIEPANREDRLCHRVSASVFFMPGGNRYLVSHCKRADNLEGPEASQDVIASSTKRERVPRSDIASVSDSIFSIDVTPPSLPWTFPEPDGRLVDTPQLVSCLGLLQQGSDGFTMDKLEPEVGLWLKNTAKNADEIARLETMASDLISTFTRDLLKERKVIAEILCLVSVLSKADFRNLFHMYFSNIEKSVLLDIHTFKGIGLLLQSASVDHLDTEDLMKILRMISTRVQNFQYLSQAALFHLVVAISSILDAMTDIKVTGLKRVELHGPLLEFLDDLQAGDDPYLEYYASYAIQALLCVPDNESPWQPTVRRTTKIVKGISGSISAVRGLDLKRFMTRLQSIQEGLEGFHELHDLTKTSPDSVMTESERGIVASLANRKQAWYAALRGADTLIQGGELAKFRILVCGASCRREIGFQLGICQRLGNLAANPLWSTEIRQNALRFLEEIYRDDLTWDQNPKVKVYILNVLDELSVTVKDLPEASLLLKDFAEDGDVSKQEIYRSFTKKGSKAGQYLLNSSTPEFAVPSLLDLLQREGDVRADLRRMAQRRIEERDGTIYVPPLAKSHLHASDDEVFPLCPVINEFLSSDQKVLLLLGDSGAGKTMFNHELDLRLWKSYLEDPNGSLIPLFINLFTIPGPEQDLIAKHLRICNFSKAQIQELRYRVFVLICDGYDESQLSQNLYDANGFNKEGGWRVKMVISCRSENLRRDYLDLFRPVRLSPTDPDLFRQAVLAPFSMNQVKDFIDQHVAIKEPLFVSADYQSIINQIPSLQGLVTSPFLLALSLEVLPRFADPGQKVDLSKITRVRLFDEFMVQWLERTKKRLEFTEMSGPEMEVFERLSDDGFIQKGLLYLRDLSAAIYKEQKGNSVVNYVKARDNKTWKERFFGQQDKKSQLLRMAMPMTRTGNQYGFIHRSFLEYGVSRAIYDPDMWVGMGLEPENEISVTRRKSVDSAFSFEMELEMEVTSHGPDPESLLVKMSFIKDTSVLQFLVERVNSEPVFKNQLLAYIKASKIDKKWRIAAANAMTILVRAGFRFSHHDLRGIQVPGADMSFGVFDSAQLQGADLRKTNLQKTWFRQADLSQARMHGVQLGELPNLDEAKMSQAFAYAPDGKRFYAGTADGRIIAYNTSTWNAIEALEGHNRRVTNVIFSSSGSLLASGADNPAGEMAARIWDVKVGICLHVLEGHTTKFAGLIFLPSDKRIITGSCSRAVHMWDLMTGACVHSFEVPQDIDTVVDAIACSSDGDLLATSYEDHSLRLWKVETSECLHVLTGLTGFNLGLAFSPGGAQFTLTSNDGIKTWEAATGAELWTSEKAVCTVGSAVYSPDGQKIACGAVGNAVSLLDPATGETTSALQGHTGEIYNIVYSQDGDQFASASRDGSVRLWSPSGDSRVVFTDNSKPALFSLFIGFSPSGHQLAGSSWDERIKLTDTGVLKQDRLLNMQPRLSHQFPAHVHLIPGGRYIASHGQDGVRIWDRDSGKLIHRLTNCQGDCEQVFISPNGLQLVTTGPRETADLWDVEKGAFLLTFDLGPYDSSRRTLVFSENNRLAATDQADVRVWNQRTFNLEQQLNGHDQRVTKIVFSPGRGDQLATSGADLTIRLWELSTGHCSLTLQGPQQEVTNIAYSPNGTRLFTSFEDGTVQVWNVCDGENLGLVNTGCSHGSSMFSPRGRFFVVYHGCDSASVEGTIVIWDMIENRLLWTLGKTVGQTMLAFSSDDRFLVSSCHDVVIRLWDLETGEEIAKTESSRGVNHSLALDLSTADRVGAGLLLIVGSKEGDVSVWALKERHDSATVTSAMDSHNSNSDSGRRGQTAAGGSLEGGDERRTYGFHLQWTTAYGVLNAEGARIEGTQGLGGTNSRVLMQNGALGEPVAPPGLGHIIKKVMTTRNVMSRLKSHQKPQVIEE